MKFLKELNVNPISKKMDKGYDKYSLSWNLHINPATAKTGAAPPTDLGPAKRVAILPKENDTLALFINYFGSPPFSEGSGAIWGDYSYDMHTFKAYEIKGGEWFYDITPFEVWIIREGRPFSQPKAFWYGYTFFF